MKKSAFWTRVVFSAPWQRQRLHGDAPLLLTREIKAHAAVWLWYISAAGNGCFHMYWHNTTKAMVSLFCYLLSYLLVLFASYYHQPFWQQFKQLLWISELIVIQLFTMSLASSASVALDKKSQISPQWIIKVNLGLFVCLFIYCICLIFYYIMYLIIYFMLFIVFSYLFIHVTLSLFYLFYCLNFIVVFFILVSINLFTLYFMCLF